MLILWDIDDTLLKTVLHVDLFHEALISLAGVKADFGIEICKSGKTDSQIAQEYINNYDAHCTVSQFIDELEWISLQRYTSKKPRALQQRA